MTGTKLTLYHYRWMFLVGGRLIDEIGLQFGPRRGSRMADHGAPNEK